MPVFGWLPPKHALKPQRRLIIGRKQCSLRDLMIPLHTRCLAEVITVDFTDCRHKRRVDTLEPAAPSSQNAGISSKHACACAVAIHSPREMP